MLWRLWWGLRRPWMLVPGNITQAKGLPTVTRQPPGPKHRHLLSGRDIHRFLRLLPDREEVVAGVRGILLATGQDVQGWYDDEHGTVVVCAWPKVMIEFVGVPWYEEHRELIDRLGVPNFPNYDVLGFGEDDDDYGDPPGVVYEVDPSRYVEVVSLEWTPALARAYQLLHVLLHELGHHDHHRSGGEQEGAEAHAEAYARRHADLVWDGYVEEFGLGSAD